MFKYNFYIFVIIIIISQLFFLNHETNKQTNQMQTHT